MSVVVGTQPGLSGQTLLGDLSFCNLLGEEKL